MLVQVAALLAIAFFFGWFLSQNWEEVRTLSLQYDVRFLFLSFGLLGLFFALLVLGWLQILRWMGFPRDALSGARVWFISQLGKYVPGKVLMAVSRVYLATQEGIAPPIGLLSLYMEILLLILAGLLLYLAIWPAWSTSGPYTWLGLAALPVGLALSYPPWLERMVNWILHRFRREPIRLGLHYGQVLRLLLFYVASWCVYGASQYCLIAAFFPLRVEAALPILGISSLSWVLGFLVLIAPAGLGIREGAQAILLAQFLPTPVAMVTPLVSRLLWSLGEGLGVLVTLVGVAVRRHKSRQQAGSNHFPDPPAPPPES
ncbi:MAG: lysylphosphatidylglycerol synthase domain-containing protein [Chloroflexia bacterium]